MNSTKADFKQYLQQTSHAIEKELNDFSKEWSEYINTNFQDLNAVNKRFTQSLYGGKMIRGALVKFGYELFQTKTTDRILKPAVAFEIIHTSLLIHDDILDQSPLRRGKPAFHISANSHYGISQAICIGDIGMTIAFKLISESNFPEELKNRALNFFSQTVSQTIIGQMLDVEYSQVYERTDEKIMNIYLMKTAHYTIVGPLTVGAILAGATGDMLEKIKLFGEHLGIAFQIQDDILGVFGDDSITGKPTTSDIEENKSTLLFTHALRQSNEAQKKILKQYYGKKKITSEQLEMIRQIFKETGSLEYSQNKLKELTEKAKAVIPSLTKDELQQNLLRQLTDILVERSK